jgi:type I restriction-modification system DNA methylase subunit
MFDSIEQGDSIRFPIDRKFDFIVSNPPFGIKGINYDEITNGIRHLYTPIKSSNAISLFL